MPASSTISAAWATVAKQRRSELGLDDPDRPNIPGLPSLNSPLAWAGEMALRKLEQLEAAKDASRAIDPRIPTDWEKFAPLCQIQSGGTVKPFNPYQFQIDAIRAIEANQYIAICKSRQMGMSETICSWLLMRVLTEPGFSAVVFSKTQEDSSKLGARIRAMAISLGPLCPEFASESKTYIEFVGLGRLTFLPVTARAARGIPSVSVVLFDEAAFIDGIEGVYQAATPTLALLGDRGKVIMNSTPNGRNGLFYRLLSGGTGETEKLLGACAKMRMDDNPTAKNNIVPFERDRFFKSWVHKKWAKVLLHWRLHPVYGADPDWAERTRREQKLTLEQWNQEFELSFSEGSKNVFPFGLVERATRGEWSAPKFGQTYAAGVDPAYGGRDYFTVRIWNVSRTPYRLVAQYRQNHRTKDYNYAQALELLDQYRPKLIAIAAPSLTDLNYQEFTKLRKQYRWEITQESNASKLVNSDRLVLLLERNLLVFPEDEDDGEGPEATGPSSEEYRHFVETLSGNTRKRNAESGTHDDTISADAALFHWIDEVVPTATRISSAKPKRRTPLN